MGSEKIQAAIIGSGNIGTDLMFKIMKNSQYLSMGAMIGIDPASDGLARAARLGVPVSAEGIDGLLALPHFQDIKIVFDATSAKSHLVHNEKLQPFGIKVIDLTPAAIGPYVVPSINLEQESNAANINMVTCGGQATIPIVNAVAQVTDVYYAEIVASIASKSAGPGTRANIDEFTETTSAAIVNVGKARAGKAIIILNPASAPLHDLHAAYDAGARVVRVATHCTEADISRQHIEFARNLGMDTVGFLMMSHMITPQELAEQAKKMESYGANCIYVVDSSGAMLMQDIRDRFRALKAILNSDTQTGMHAHNNLSVSIANSLTAIEEGCDRVDTSLAGMGAGAGNTPTEVFIGCLEKQGWQHGCQLDTLINGADDVVRPLQHRPVRVDRETLSLGLAGVYSSFLLHAERASQKYGISTMDILMELGKRKMVGGQEDMIVDVALDLKNANTKQAQ